MIYDIAFLIAAFNEEDYIEDCIYSCLAEKSYAVQICAVSDGSTDKTPLILSRLADKYQNVFINIFATNQGKVAAFNAAYSLAQAHYLSILGADDLSMPFRIKESIRALNNADLVFGDLESFNKLKTINTSLMSSKFGITESRSFSFSDLLYRPCVFGGTITMNISIARKIFPVNPRISHEDWWIPLVSSWHGKVTYINKVLCRYRQHPRQTSKYQASFPSLSKFNNWRSHLSRDIPYYELILTTFPLDRPQKNFTLQKLLVLYCIRGCGLSLKLRSIGMSLRSGLTVRRRILDIIAATCPFAMFLLSNLVQFLKTLSIKQLSSSAQ